MNILKNNILSQAMKWFSGIVIHLLFPVLTIWVLNSPLPAFNCAQRHRPPHHWVAEHTPGILLYHSENSPGSTLCQEYYTCGFGTADPTLKLRFSDVSPYAYLRADFGFQLLLSTRWRKHLSNNTFIKYWQFWCQHLIITIMKFLHSY